MADDLKMMNLSDQVTALMKMGCTVSMVMGRADEVLGDVVRITISHSSRCKAIDNWCFFEEHNITRALDMYRRAMERRIKEATCITS